jgi:hypothetical protein
MPKTSLRPWYRTAASVQSPLAVANESDDEWSRWNLARDLKFG